MKYNITLNIIESSTLETSVEADTEQEALFKGYALFDNGVLDFNMREEIATTLDSIEINYD